MALFKNCFICYDKVKVVVDDEELELEDFDLDVDKSRQNVVSRSRQQRRLRRRELSAACAEILCVILELPTTRTPCHRHRGRRDSASSSLLPPPQGQKVQDYHVLQKLNYCADCKNSLKEIRLIVEQMETMENANVLLERRAQIYNQLRQSWRKCRRRRRREQQQPKLVPPPPATTGTGSFVVIDDDDYVDVEMEEETVSQFRDQIIRRNGLNSIKFGANRGREDDENNQFATEPELLGPYYKHVDGRDNDNDDKDNENDSSLSNNGVTSSPSPSPAESLKVKSCCSARTGTTAARNSSKTQAFDDPCFCLKIPKKKNIKKSNFVQSSRRSQIEEDEGSATTKAATSPSKPVLQNKCKRKEKNNLISTIAPTADAADSGIGIVENLELALESESESKSRDQHQQRPRPHAISSRCHSTRGRGQEKIKTTTTKQSKNTKSKNCPEDSEDFSSLPLPDPEVDVDGPIPDELSSPSPPTKRQLRPRPGRPTRPERPKNSSKRKRGKQDNGASPAASDSDDADIVYEKTVKRIIKKTIASTQAYAKTDLTPGSNWWGPDSDPEPKKHKTSNQCETPTPTALTKDESRSPLAPEPEAEPEVPPPGRNEEEFGSSSSGTGMTAHGDKFFDTHADAERVPQIKRGTGRPRKSKAPHDNLPPSKKKRIQIHFPTYSAKFDTDVEEKTGDIVDIQSGSGTRPSRRYRSCHGNKSKPQPKTTKRRRLNHGNAVVVDMENSIPADMNLTVDAQIQSKSKSSGEVEPESETVFENERFSSEDIRSALGEELVSLITAMRTRTQSKPEEQKDDLNLTLTQSHLPQENQKNQNDFDSSTATDAAQDKEAEHHSNLSFEQCCQVQDENEDEDSARIVAEIVDNLISDCCQMELQHGAIADN